MKRVLCCLALVLPARKPLRNHQGPSIGRSGRALIGTPSPRNAACSRNGRKTAPAGLADQRDSAAATALRPSPLGESSA